ncbi:NAD-dependent epimerase/dehydratase family protein [Rothia sp. LK2588]|uniref:NAD-dependent epimerase/dehydratase family protein n=1 Tax=Rothia sp. LK2588 TaxID=3114369 RepID=UPI0034CFCD2F
MKASNWKVLGASGFVGSSVLSRLRADGIDADPIEAPRLATKQTDPKALAKEATSLEGIIDSLADSFAGADVVINAAGVAAPNQQELHPLLGANALLPVVVAIAAQRTGVKRLIHLSSAAVQGPVRRLDASTHTDPFSAYSYSKALGEKALLLTEEYVQKSAAAGVAPGSKNSIYPAAPASAPVSVAPDHALELCIVRATSVQGSGRRTTEAFAKFASTPLASVAGKGDRRSPVSSSYALAEFVSMVGRFEGKLPSIVVQPWEGSTCESVIVDAGRRHPLHLPTPLCAAAIKAGYAVSDLADGRWQAAVRRVEVMWFGQKIDDSWARENGLVPEPRVQEVLRTAHSALGKKADRRFAS